MAPYFYTRLPDDRSIRLLETRPSATGALCYSMRNTILDDAPRYLALSYTWDKPVFDYSLQCDGREMAVTANLYAALRQIRERHEFADIHFVWADAVCIDQSNIEERGQQVQLMRRIYESAHLTFVYLGEPEELGSCKTAMAAVEEAQGRDGWFRFDIAQDALIFDAVYELFMQPWFLRVWIIQEYAVSRALMIGYGNELCSAAELTKFADSIEIYPHRDEPLKSPAERFEPLDLARMSFLIQNFSSLDILRSDVQDGRARDLSNLLNPDAGSVRDATDPRDMVYALIGLVQGRKKEEVDLVPDYSLSVAKVYLQAAGFILEQEGLIPLLEGCDRPSTIDGLPSWVPDWSNVPPTDTRPLVWYGDWSAGGNMKCEWQFRKQAQMLSVRGMFFDTVLETNDARGRIVADTPNHILMSSLGLGAYNLTRRSESMISDADIKTLLYRTLLLYEWEGLDGEQPALSRLPCYPNSTLYERTSKDDEIGSLVRQIVCNLKTYEYCLTQNKRVGMLPLDTQKGDHICVFQGVATPYVLRKHGLADTYTLIGACYIDGVMREEAFNEDGLQYIDLV